MRHVRAPDDKAHLWEDNMASIRAAALAQCAAIALTFGYGGQAWSQSAGAIAPRAEPGVVHGPGIATPIKRGSKPGYDFQDQYIGVPGKVVADNMEPVVDHPDQTSEVARKLSALEKRTGKKPNILVFLLDDVGWMDFGFNGGGGAVGAPTPDVDRVASQGLILRRPILRRVARRLEPLS
jgi:hypothetical protein